MRRGDVLQDKPSRQALFRSLSHEIRTSITALKGYLDMMNSGEANADVPARMGHALKRLETVVKRLDEFRNELEVES